MCVRQWGERVSSLVDRARESIASYANATLTMTYWQVGAIIDSEVLGEERAEYGAQILVTLSQELVDRYGRSFEEKNLRRMVQFARLFPEVEISTFVERQKRMVIDDIDLHLDLLFATDHCSAWLPSNSRSASSMLATKVRRSCS